MATSDGVAVEVHGTTQLPNSILSWYDETRPMWIDLVGDYAGKELFLLEGDSLLRECFADERIDFQGNDFMFLLMCCSLVPHVLILFGEFHIGHFTKCLEYVL